MDHPGNPSTTPHPQASSVPAPSLTAATFVSPGNSAAQKDSPLAVNWLVVGALFLAVGLVTYSRWSRVRATRRLNAAAEAYASRQLAKLKSLAEIEAFPSRLLENAPCSS